MAKKLEDAIGAYGIALAELLVAVVTAARTGGSAASAAEPAAAPAGRKRGKVAAAEPATTVDEVRTALIALSEAKDKQAVIDVLSRFGVAKIGDLPEENYRECKEIAEAETAESGEEGDPFSE